MNLLKVYNPDFTFKSSDFRLANHVKPRPLPFSDSLKTLFLRERVGWLVFGNPPQLTEDDFVEVLLTFYQIATL